MDDLFEDLRDGHNLVSLLEVLSGDHLVRIAFEKIYSRAFLRSPFSHIETMAAQRNENNERKWPCERRGNGLHIARDKQENNSHSIGRRRGQKKEEERIKIQNGRLGTEK